MAMNLLTLVLLYITTLVVTSLHLLLPATSFHEWHASAPQGLLLDEKTRLGSTPPNCHNRCNECNPCRAVQVPTQPIHNRVDPINAVPMDLSSSLIDNKYSNYKPLEWKCQCGNRLFNP
ncbi:EPIDERMAL PATTERNING FACTOR-like protein 1 [Tasmannia lanceolata]|uniref:EPIDERMAL PATTERNING FACTOR-like protein 1 n=1 Tax=Tasmannia lanceolata TaxID=3420 RepID=UPI00406336B5